MNDLNAPELLKNLLNQLPPLSIEDVSSRVGAALHRTTNPTQRVTQATQVLFESVETPDLFVALAKHIPTPWVDFLSGDHSLWSKIINQTVNEIQCKGAGTAHPLFALVRRWSHPQSVHGIKSTQHPISQLYWSAMETIALHDSGNDFVETVRSTKGPVRQWMDDFHRHVGHPQNIDGVSLLEKMMLDLPRTPTTDRLWIWRVERNSQWDQGYKELPYDKLCRSTLAPSILAFTIWRNKPGQIPDNLRKNIFRWDNPLELINELKNRYSASAVSDFLNSVIEEQLKFPLSENVWKAFVGDPLKFMLSLDIHADVYGLMDEYKNTEPRRSRKNHTEKVIQFMAKMWQDAGRMQKSENDPWIKLTHALHTTGLLPHVVFKSWGCLIESENIRWKELNCVEDPIVMWNVVRNSQELTPISLSEDFKRLVLLKMMECAPLQYQQMIEHNPDICPSELTNRQRLTIAKTLCDQIVWNEQPLKKIQWMADFFKQVNNMQSSIDARTLIIRSFLTHFNIASDALAATLTHDTESGRLLQDVLRHTTDEQFPYDHQYERPYSQTIEKFLLLEATQYNSHTVPPSKRKM